MRTHAVGDEEDVPPFLPLLRIAGQLGRVSILIMGTADAHVGQACVLDIFVSNHQLFPRILTSPPINFMLLGSHSVE
jgi:hypothetical protein